MRYVFLNALPLNALGITKPTKLTVTPVSPGVLRQLAPEMKPRVSFIRHPATVRLVNDLLGLGLKPESGLYHYEEGDVLIVITLKRPVRGAEVSNLTENDIEVFQVEVF